MVGEIHLANIYFTNAAASKIRPVLLLKQNSFNDLLYLPLTSNTNVKGIYISNNDLKDGYLPKLSVAVHEKISVIAPGLLVKKIATLNAYTYQMVIEELINYLKQ